MIYCSIGWYDPQPMIRTDISTCRYKRLTYLEYQSVMRKEEQSPQCDEHKPGSSYTLPNQSNTRKGDIQKCRINTSSVLFPEINSPNACFFPWLSYISSLPMVARTSGVGSA